MSCFVDSRSLLSCRLISIFRSKFLYLSINRFHMASRNEAKQHMEIVKVPPIVSTYRQALRTFDKKNEKDLQNNIKKLKTMMDKLKPEDLGFDKSMASNEYWEKPNKAPCTYIEVFQNNVINMSIFVLKPGFKMPLHDHPHMHGLLKVISGAVKIRSFTEHPLKEQKSAEESVSDAKTEAKRLSSGSHKRRKFFATVTADKVCNSNADTCVLTPTSSNFHEIQALEMPAAFFDILAPPYDTFIEDIGPRRCCYYKVKNEISTNMVELKEIDVPECFYCDQAPYLGPVLSGGYGSIETLKYLLRMSLKI